MCIGKRERERGGEMKSAGTERREERKRGKGGKGEGGEKERKL